MFIQHAKGRSGTVTGLALVLVLGLMASPSYAQGNAQPTRSAHNPALDEAVFSTLSYCEQHFPSCAEEVKSGAGELVFPSVVKADLLIGGSGGRGALVEHGKITGYYDIGAASAGLQIGVDNASQVYIFPNEKSMASLKNGNSYWRVGANEGVTLMAADANARNVTGKTTAYIFNSKGLQGGIDVDLFDVWKTGTARPAATQSNP